MCVGGHHVRLDRALDPGPLFTVLVPLQGSLSPLSFNTAGFLRLLLHTTLLAEVGPGIVFIRGGNGYTPY